MCSSEQSVGGVVSLAAYRGKAAVLLALFRGLYCPFCRRQMAQLSPTAQRLQMLGIETVGVVATAEHTDAVHAVEVQRR